MVYIIGNINLNYFKIGYTKDKSSFKRRFNSIKTSIPFEFDYEKVLIGNRDTEKRLHIHLKDRKIVREWFKICDILNEIENIHKLCFNEFDDKSGSDWVTVYTKDVPDNYIRIHKSDLEKQGEDTDIYDNKNNTTVGDINFEDNKSIISDNNLIIYKSNDLPFDLLINKNDENRIHEKKGFKIDGFLFLWHNKELYRLPSTSGNKSYKLKKLNIIKVGNKYGYRVKREKISFNKLMFKTTFIGKEFEAIKDKVYLPI